MAGQNGYLASMHLDKPTFEIFEMAAIVVILLLSRKKVGPLTNVFGGWCVAGLAVDVFVWHCVRPWYVQEAFNACNILIGLVIIYEHLKEKFTNLLVFCLSLFM